MDFDFDKAAANPWLASGIGSLLSLKFMAGDSWGERALNAAITYGCGVVGGGALVDHIGNLGGKAAAGVVLLTAAFCLVVYQVCVQAILKTDIGSALAERVRKFLGLDPNKEG